MTNNAEREGFEREVRYVVVKLKDLSEHQRRTLNDGLIQARIPTRECAVVEADWPEYEPVWAMIEARMTGQARAQASGVPDEVEPQGTFECPVCGFDKPHYHSPAEASINWHSDYQAIFEDIVFKNLRFDNRELTIGLGGDLRPRGGGHFLAYKAEDARRHSGKRIEGLIQEPWSEFNRSRPENGDYEKPWMNALWNIFKQTVIAVKRTAPTPPKSASVPVERLEAFISAWRSKSIPYSPADIMADDIEELIAEYKA